MAVKEYIEREAYYQQINNLSKGKHGDYCAAINDCMTTLDEQPVADVVEVVRCTACGNYCENTGECNLYGHQPGKDGYCSNAIPKEREEQ